MTPLRLLSAIAGACLTLSACTVLGDDDPEEDPLAIAQATLTAQATQSAPTSTMEDALTWLSDPPEPRIVLTEPGWSMGALGWSPDGSKLAASADLPGSESGSGHRVYVWDAEGRLLNAPGDQGSTIADLAWSADSDLLASAGSDGAVRLWNANGELQDTLAVSEGTRTIRTLAWSPDEDILAVGASETTREQGELAYYVYLLQPDGGLIARLDGGPTAAGAYSLAWSPDGSLLVGRPIG